MKPRSVNMNVDSGEKTWLTPRYIIDALGPFDTDPCCPDGGMPWPTATRMITKSEDGLAQAWEGHVWLNPPYGREALPFFRQMTSYRGGVLALCLYARTRRFGKTTSSHSRQPFFIFADGFASIVKTGVSTQPRPHLLFLSHTANGQRRDFTTLFATSNCMDS